MQDEKIQVSCIFKPQIAMAVGAYGVHFSRKTKILDYLKSYFILALITAFLINEERKI